MYKWFFSHHHFRYMVDDPDAILEPAKSLKMVAFDLVCFQMVGLVKCCTTNVTNKWSFSSMGQHMPVQTEGASEAFVANVANVVLAEWVVVQLK